jgi:predicted RNase H-like HicB family nuclease
MSQSLVALSVKLEARTRYDGSVWLAWCPPLDVMTQAENEQRALASLREAVELWFESCIARNVLDQALTEAGFHRRHRGDDVPSDASFFVRVSEEQSQVASVGASTTAAFTRERDIEVSIPAYIAAQCVSSSDPRVSH